MVEVVESCSVRFNIQYGRIVSPSSKVHNNCTINCANMALKCSWLSCCLFLLLERPPWALSVASHFSGGEVNALSPHRTAAAQRLKPCEPTQPSSTPTKIFLDLFVPVSEVDPQFLSVTIDAGDISSNWSGINFTAPRIVNMAKALNPAVLRVGGTSGDYLLFNQTTPDLSSKGMQVE